MRINDTFLLFMNNVDVDDTWILDSGCTNHMSNRKDWFINETFKQINAEMVSSQSTET